MHAVTSNYNPLFSFVYERDTPLQYEKIIQNEKLS